MGGIKFIGIIGPFFFENEVGDVETINSQWLIQGVGWGPGGGKRGASITVWINKKGMWLGTGCFSYFH